MPFVFIFNPEILLIDIQNWAHLIWVILVSTVAILLFAAATMGWFVIRSRLWESAVLLICCFILFRPGWVLDRFYPAAVEVPAATFMQKIEQAPDDQRIVFIVQGINIEGEDVRKTVSLPLGHPQEPRLRLRASGLGVTPMGDNIMISDVAFGSYAKRIGLDVGYEIVAVLEPTERPSRVIPAAIALLVAFGIGALQYARDRKLKPAAA